MRVFKIIIVNTFYFNESANKLLDVVFMQILQIDNCCFHIYIKTILKYKLLNSNAKFMAGRNWHTKSEGLILFISQPHKVITDLINCQTPNL